MKTSCCICPTSASLNDSFRKLHKVRSSPSMGICTNKLTGVVSATRCRLWLQTYSCPNSNTTWSLLESRRSTTGMLMIFSPRTDRYVDDIFTKKSKNEPDELLEAMNSCHSNIKFTVEETPSHFLDTELHFTGNSFSTSVFKKPGKLLVHWLSQVPKNWKKNAILASLHRAKRIASNWESEVKKIRDVFQSWLPDVVYWQNC